MFDRKEKILQYTEELCMATDSRLLYLTFFGSELYGTLTDSSDTDIRGIFLPSLKSVILKRDRKSLHYSTGDDAHRNSHKDIDIDLWSINNWIQNLLPNADTGAIDLLFSVSNPSCIIFKDHLLDPVFENPLKFLNLANKTYTKYSLSQAKKYGIKGSRLGTIKAVWNWLENHDIQGKLGPYINDIITECGHDSYCFAKDLDEVQSLVLCGKFHIGSTSILDFRNRVSHDMKQYEIHAHESKRKQGIDFKALSHALRALDQMEELLLTGKIKFPLANRERLKSVKMGNIPWTELESIILARLSDVDKLHERLAGKYAYNPAVAEKFLLSCYTI